MVTYSCPSGHVVLLDDEPPAALSVGSHGYAQFWNGETVVLLHRWLLGLGVGDPRKGDHINRNVLDNRLINLRVVNASESSANVSGRGAVAYRGVSVKRGKYEARCKYQGKTYHLGVYDDPAVAAEVAREWRMKHMVGALD